jgi:hypothetical protein
MHELRTAALAALVACGLSLPAAAQMLGAGVPMPGMAPGAAPAAPPRAAPGAPPGAPQGAPPCFREFLPLRDEAQKRGAAIKAAADRKAPRQELCQAFRRFAESEAKLVKFIEENKDWCGIPAQAATEVKANHGRTLQMRQRVCATGPVGAEGGPPKPSGPGLSEALGTYRPAAEGSTGRGTFDTLTGNVLGK